jgi:hypothetical protein
MLIQIAVTSANFISSCTTQDNFNNANCFNDIIVFNDKKYRAGHTLTNQKNETFIMFSDDSPGDSRLIYALKKNGRGFYENEVKIKVYTLSDEGYYEKHDGRIDVKHKYIGRYESINEFIYLKDDNDRKKQYLFTVSSYVSLTELYDIENGLHQQWKTAGFFNISEDHYIFSYRFSLFEWAKSNVYFCAYVQFEYKNENYEDYSISYTISRFRFDRDTSGNKITSRVVEKTQEFKENYDNRIVSAIYVDKYEVIALFFVKQSDKRLTLNFYDYDLKEINEYAYETLTNPQTGYGAFLKIVHCQYEYAGLMY